MNRPSSQLAAPPKTCEVVVVGGGIIGTSITYHLAERGVDVVLVEKNDLASGCSGATAAWLMMQGKTPAWYMEFSRDSAWRYPDLAEQLDGDIDYCRSGGLTFLFSEQQLEDARELAAVQNEHGLEVELLDREQTLDREPLAGPRVLASMYCATDANINPFSTVQALARTAERHGAAVCTRTAVRDIAVEGGRVAGVQTDRGFVSTRHVVNAAGVAAPQIVQLAGSRAELIPVRPVRGQVLVSERLPRLINHTVQGFRQTLDGNIVSGYMQQEVGFDNRNTFTGLTLLGREAVEHFPFLRDIALIRAFSGLRPMPRDGFPIIDRLPGLTGFYVAVMHSGVVLAPTVGLAVAELILTGKRKYGIERFKLTRFNNSSA